MTDIEKLKALLTEFGVGFTVEDQKDTTRIRCDEGNAKVRGYASFYTEFEFDADGKFVAMGAWE